jgi:hypothetical protein
LLLIKSLQLSLFFFYLSFFDLFFNYYLLNLFLLVLALHLKASSVYLVDFSNIQIVLNKIFVTFQNKLILKYQKS